MKFNANESCQPVGCKTISVNFSIISRLNLTAKHDDFQTVHFAFEGKKVPKLILPFKGKEVI